jgi:Ca2+-binding RTX toxin-like protein
MSGSITVPGTGSTPNPISLKFTTPYNISLADQIALALAEAAASHTLTVVNYTGGPSIPTLPPGSTEELVLSPTVSGSITVPAAASGVTEVLVITNSQPLTIHGTPGLEILGGDKNLTIIDPTVIDYADNGLTTNTDAVTVTSADSPYEVAMRAGSETVVGLGSGTIGGGVGANYINLSGAGVGTNNLVLSQGFHDRITAGGGSVTVDASGSHAIIQGGAGDLSIDDTGLANTVWAAAGNAAVTTGGLDALVLGSSGLLTVNAAGGVGDTVAFGPGGGTFYSSTNSYEALVFAGFGTSVSVDASNTTYDTIVGDTGALTVNAGSATNLLVWGPISGPGMDFIGGSGGAGATAATVVGQSGHDTIGAGTGPLYAWVGANETLQASSGGGNVTLFGGVNSDITYTAASGSLLFVANSGNETLNAAGSSTNDVMWGGIDSTSGNSLVGGSGNDIMIAGTGADTFNTGAGNNEFVFIASVLGSSSQTDVLTNFLGGNDSVVLSGGLTTVSSSSGGTGPTAFTTLTLSDNTQVTFLGVSSASQLAGHIFSN